MRAEQVNAAPTFVPPVDLDSKVATHASEIPAPSTLDIPLSTDPNITPVASTSSSVTTQIKTQGAAYNIRPNIQTDFHFHCPTVSISSAATLTSDDEDEIEDFVNIPSVKKQKKKNESIESMYITASLTYASFTTMYY